MELSIGIAIGSDTIDAVVAGRAGVTGNPVLSITADDRPRLGAHPGHDVFRDFADRVGDPVPVIGTAGGARLGADLVALTIGELARDATRLTIAHPAAWTAYQSGILRSALTCTRAAELPTSWTSRPVAARQAAGGPVDQPLLVIDIGPTCTELSLLAGSRVLDTTSTDLLGAAWLDRLLAAHLTSRLPAPPDRTELADLVAACARARAELTVHPDAVVQAARLRTRVTRSEFDDLIRDRVHGTVAAAARLCSAADLDVSAVLVVGEPAHTPLLHELLTERLRLPIAVPDDPAHAVPRGAAALSTRRFTVPGGPAPKVTRSSAGGTSIGTRSSASGTSIGTARPPRAVPAPSPIFSVRRPPAPPGPTRPRPDSLRPPVAPRPAGPPALTPGKRLRTAVVAAAAGLAVLIGGAAATGGGHSGFAGHSHGRA